MKRSQVHDYRDLRSVDDLGLEIKDGEYVLPDGTQWCSYCDSIAHECICDYIFYHGEPERVEDDESETME